MQRQLTKNNIKINSKITDNDSKRIKEIQTEETHNYFLIPIIIILCFIPLVVKLTFYNPHLSNFSWFSNITSQSDFFLYFKQMDFIYIAGIMAFIIAIMLIFVRKNVRRSPIFIPLGIYAALALLSAIGSQYSSICFKGGFEQFESVLALLGYCITAYYTFQFIKSEQDIKRIHIALIVITIILSIIGLTQFLGHDFFASQAGYKMIVPESLRARIEKLDFVMGDKTVYMTLYNPNYVGVYVALLMPILAIMLFFQKKIVLIILSIISVCGLMISLIGSKSLAGFIGIAVFAISTLIFMWRYLIKRIYITIPVVVLILVALIVINIKTDNYFINKLSNSLHMQKTEYALTDLHTEDRDISVTYNGNIIKVQYTAEASIEYPFQIMDSQNNNLIINYDPASTTYFITDKKYKGLSFALDMNKEGSFYILSDNMKFHFIKKMSDGKYYFINNYGKYDKIVNAKSAIFTGYENIASGRGYIWSRTIPLMKEYIILGSGPDTFTMVFPQRDYLNLVRYGYADKFITKPHSMYLQMAVQTGLLSLIAFLVFYGMYFVSSIRLYIYGRFTSYYAKMGVAVFIATLSYMITGFANDSSIATAPTFWTIMGLGIALNYKVKPLISKEIEEIKTKKAE